MIQISATIITYQEQEYIAACIRSLQRVADEVIVVDSHSTDDTVKIATSLGARVVIRDFDGYGQQKNYAASIATHDFILSLDGDEIFSEALIQSLLREKQTHTHHLYVMNRLNYIGNTPIKSCGLYPDVQRRLYDRRYARWAEPNVHEQVKPLSPNTIIQPLTGDILHYSYHSITDFQERGMKYARLGAMDKSKYSKPVLVIKMLSNSFFAFFKSYFVKRGFTDGLLGLQISALKARHTFYKYYFALVQNKRT